MTSLALRGALLALFGALTVALGSALGLDLDHVALLGVAIGGLVGLVPDRSLVERIAGFLVGFAVAWVGYGLRAAVLPDTNAGRAVAVFLVLIVLMVVAVASMARIPLWALLAGAVAMTGSYEETYVASPSQFLSESPTAATTVLLAMAMGILGSLLLGEDVVKRRAREETSRHREGVSA